MKIYLKTIAFALCPKNAISFVLMTFRWNHFDIFDFFTLSTSKSTHCCKHYFDKKAFPQMKLSQYLNFICGK